MKPDIRTITVSAVIGAAYAALTVMLAPISYGAVQLRVSEALCVLPFFVPETAWGLFVGCALANLMTGNLTDVVFGSAATLLAAMLTARIGRHGDKRGAALLACLMPVWVNALVVGAVITAAYNGMSLISNPGILALNAGQVALGEAAVMLLLGLPLMRILPKYKFFREITDRTVKERSRS